MLTEVCKSLNNWFEKNKKFGTFKIENGTLAPCDFLQDGQYFRVVGSVFNDGVHLFPASDLTDEVFEGAVWAMAVPPYVIALTAEIEAYNASEAAKPTAYTAESFGGYSYSKATDAQGVAADWHTVFGAKLKQWRKL